MGYLLFPLVVVIQTLSFVRGKKDTTTTKIYKAKWNWGENCDGMMHNNANYQHTHRDCVIIELNLLFIMCHENLLQWRPFYLMSTAKYLLLLSTQCVATLYEHNRSVLMCLIMWMTMQIKHTLTSN